MGIASNIMDFFRGKKTAEAQEQPFRTDNADGNAAPSSEQPTTQPSTLVPESKQESQIFPSDAAEQVLINLLSAQPVKMKPPPGSSLQVVTSFPKIDSLRLVAPNEIDSKGWGAQIEQGQNQAELHITFSDNNRLGHFDRASIDAAIKNVLKSIKPLHEGLIFEPPQKPENFSDIWAKIEPLIDRNPNAFSARDKEVLKAYFAANPDYTADLVSFGQIGVKHGKDQAVSIIISPSNVPVIADASGAEKQEAPDYLLEQYFKKPEHHQAILAKFKEKAMALPLLAQDHEVIQHLDMKVNTRDETDCLNRNEVEIEFGVRCPDGKFKDSHNPLMKLPQEEMAKLFTEAVVEAKQELPSILGQIASTEAIGDILKKRLPNEEAALKPILEHEMFKSISTLEKEHKKDPRHHVGNMKTNEMENKVMLSFPLPAKEVLKGAEQDVTLDDLRHTIVQPQKNGTAHMPHHNPHASHVAAVTTTPSSPNAAAGKAA